MKKYSHPLALKKSALHFSLFFIAYLGMSLVLNLSVTFWSLLFQSAFFTLCMHFTLPMILLKAQVSCTYDGHTVHGKLVLTPQHLVFRVDTMRGETIRTYKWEKLELLPLKEDCLCLLWDGVNRLIFI
ncbi:hypothetical protein A3SI_19281 [Nitritalea halalkaliphila LW7]|uniref:GRAM domain-containing protein n=1 Tax=Nitritalea halalkaliphila LW7 TaxID=1189621 RepID=I5BTF4_9BACT|nr:hypothetical protein [Nitritalea halalkaliphila]EIM72856.1 hypothetical protein A3SI_19281 [Nitritalea halalkaliphila LW7]